MSSPSLPCAVLDNLALVPHVWREEILALHRQAGLADGLTAEAAEQRAQEALRFRVFNPTLVAQGDGYALCYRVVADNTDVRRMATCRLTRDFQIVPGSLTPWSSLVQFARADELNARALSWHADPRYLRLRGKLHVIWNDGANRPANHQFIVEMDEQGLVPAGLAREIVRPNLREPIEKNWMLFEADGGMWATYAIQPHQILSVDFDQPARIEARLAHEEHWSNPYQKRFGTLRGSAQPLLHGDSFLAIAHSSYKSPEGRRYCAAFYRHAAKAPFEVISASAAPLTLPNPRGEHFEMEKLNKAVAEVIYPCGFVLEGEEAVIAYGLNDEACAITRVPLALIESQLAPVSRQVSLTQSQMPDWVRSTPVPAMPAPKAAVPLFWWDARGKKLDGGENSRLFQTGNFGDIASKEIVENVGRLLTRQPRPGERKLLAIGSVLHTARDGDVIWGTGAKGSKLGFGAGVTQLSVHAVRGPLTAEMLRRNNIDISRIRAFFDPGCLVPVLYREQIEAARRSGQVRQGGVRIIPHYRDDREWRALHPGLVGDFISVDASPAEMITQILGAERVVSSSLHGLIFAEALGIPAVWLAPDGKEDQMKYFDYYYGSGRSQVRRSETLPEALRAEPMPLPRFDMDAYLATFPLDEVMALGQQSFGIDVGAVVPLGNQPAGVREASVQMAGFDRVDRVGSWLTEPVGHLKTELCGTKAGARYRLRLTLHPFNPVEGPRPQSVALRVNGGAYRLLGWEPGSKEIVHLDTEVVGVSGSTPLHIELCTDTLMVPKALGLSPIDKPLSVCLTALAFQPWG